MDRPYVFPCATCPHVMYMNNACGHKAVYGRDLDWPERPTSHFPITYPQWCPVAPKKKEDTK